MYFSQVKQASGDNFSYIIADEISHEAAIVDSSFNINELIRAIKAEHFKLEYIVNTHGHSDHIAGNEKLHSIFGAKIVAHRLSHASFNMVVDDGDVLQVGAVSIRIIYTPGHTPDGISLLVDGKKLLTGDTLFVGECGRTDLSGGSSKSMYDSLLNKLSKLDDDVGVYPGHDYGSKPYSTIGEEKRTNYTLKPRSLSDFIEFMKEP